MPPIRIGTTHMLHWDNRPQQQVFAEGVERMVLAEELGFWSAWVTEHHFANDPEYLPYDAPEARYPAYDLVSDPLDLPPYVAGRTSRIRLGTGVLVLPLRRPAPDRGARRHRGPAERRAAGARHRPRLRIPRARAVFHVADGDTSRRKYHESLEIIFKRMDRGAVRVRGRVLQLPGDQGRTGAVATAAPSAVPRQRVGRNPGHRGRARGIPYASVRGAWGAASLAEHKRTADFYRVAAAEHGVDISNLYFPHVLTMYCAPSRRRGRGGGRGVPAALHPHDRGALRAGASSRPGDRLRSH